MDPIHSLRQHLVKLLEGEEAHVSFGKAVADFPVGLRGAKPTGVPHSAWELLEHIRIAQWDILEFSRDPKHESPAWPDGYWPKTEKPADETAWDKSVALVLADLKAMQELVSDPKSDLFTSFAHGTGQTLLREALLVADHNAYHVGQLVWLRQQLGAWR